MLILHLVDTPERFDDLYELQCYEYSSCQSLFQLLGAMPTYRKWWLSRERSRPGLRPAESRETTRISSYPLLQGLPQGSVLLPVLFLLYIENLRRVLPESVEVAMFADDDSLFSSHPNKEVAEAAIQEAITNVAEWSRRRLLTFNASKCEVDFFTNNSKEARWQPSVQLDGVLLTTTSLPKFLGVTIDRALSFGPHVAAVVSKASNRCQVGLKGNAMANRVMRPPARLML